MCGRYNLITDGQALVDFFGIENVLFDPGELGPRYNIAPSQSVPIVKMGEKGRELSLARWGLVPHWSKEEKPKFSTINARAETVAEKPAYRESFKRRRCLIPATGFYEWKQEDGSKTPYHIHMPEGGLFAFAGLWDHWEHEAVSFNSCAIIVTDANTAMRPIHERMPVILGQAMYNTWLNADHFNPAQLKSMLAPYSGPVKADPVSRYVNSPEHDDSGCITVRGL